MSADSILTTVRQYLEYDPMVPVTLVPIHRGASGRTIVRVITEEYEPFIGISWTDDRPDNDMFPAVTHFLLEKVKLNVADLLYEDARWRVALVEDLGDEDLLSLKGRPWDERKPYYESALEQLDRLFFCRAARDVEFNPPFNEKLYRWEQEYFFEFLVDKILEKDSEKLRSAPEFKDLAQRLGVSARQLVHRDFQSQNLMLNDGKAWWIDYQGMRRGYQEYDLASLIYDPYMEHSEEEEEKLMDLWEEIAEDRPMPQLFQECAIQRLMQALGAYGNILHKGGDEWYRTRIPVAAKSLMKLTAGSTMGELLKPFLEAAQEV